MSSTKQFKTLIGGAGPTFSKPDTTAEDLDALFEVLKKHHVKDIDSAIIYGQSEENLGKFGAAEKGFTLDTKIPGGFSPDTAKEENLVNLGHESLRKLNVKKVNILYIHSPPLEEQFEESLSGINTLYKEGAFNEFGLSNYTPAQVQKAYDICKEKGYPLPTVYQGSYHAFGRHYESEDGLLPLLRKLGISFYAYSPAAGGFLSKKTEDLFTTKGGRFDVKSGSSVAGMYNKLYSDRPSLMEGQKKWIEIATKANIKPAAMALRWVKYNSALSAKYGDGIIVGGRTLEQVNESLSELEQGPLPDDVASQINDLWSLVKDEAITDNYHDFAAKK